MIPSEVLLREAGQTRQILQAAETYNLQHHLAQTVRVEVEDTDTFLTQKACQSVSPPCIFRDLNHLLGNGEAITTLSIQYPLDHYPQRKRQAEQWRKRRL